jgi:large subunit ribosomal protein L10
LKSRIVRAKEIEELHQAFISHVGIVFTEYQGLNAAEMAALRRLLSEASLKYRVVKNTLAIKAAEKTRVAACVDYFRGPVGLAMSENDPVNLAKKMLAYTKENEKLKIKGAVVEGKICNYQELEQLSTLPPKEVLLSTLLGAIQAPASKFASLLNATISRFLYALEALKTKKSEQG